MSESSAGQKDFCLVATGVSVSCMCKCGVVIVSFPGLYPRAIEKAGVNSEDETRVKLHHDAVCVCPLQRQFEENRNAELVETQRLEEQERRRREEKVIPRDISS